MEQVTFIIENKKDKNLLIALADRLGLKKIVRKEKNVIKKENPEEWFKIIDAGADVSNFGDPSEWQKEIRKSISTIVQAAKESVPAVLRKSK